VERASAIVAHGDAAARTDLIDPELLETLRLPARAVNDVQDEHRCLLLVDAIVNNKGPDDHSVNW
jgi:hypothetical protein